MIGTIASRSITSFAAPAPTLAGRNDGDLATLDRLGTLVALGRDAPLFHDGDPARYCYKILTGAVRSCRLLADGRRHINDFLLPGDYIGLDAEDGYRFTAEAVTQTTLMRYPRQRIDQLIGQQPRLGRSLREVLCGGICAAQRQMLLLGRKSAIERVATFLLTMAERAGEEDHVTLLMTRADIADHLGLTTETVSRSLTRLKERRVIAFAGTGKIIFKSVEALEDCAEAL